MKTRVARHRGKSYLYEHNSPAMPSYNVICITSPDGVSTHEFISHIGYYDSASNPRVIIPVAETVARIGANKDEFYVRTLYGSVIYVEVEWPIARRPFIKTKPDPTKRDYLLSLPRC